MTSVVAFYYAHNHKQKDSVLQDRLYQVVLIASLVTVPILGFIGSIGNLDTFALLWAIEYTVPFVIIAAISYVVIRHFRPEQKSPLTLSTIALSMGLVATSFISQLGSLINPYYIFILVVGGVGGVIVWLLYLWLIVRHT